MNRIDGLAKAMMEFLQRILWELHPDVDFESTENLIDEGILDSFDIVTIVAEVSAELGVNIPAGILTREELVNEVMKLA